MHKLKEILQLGPGARLELKTYQGNTDTDAKFAAHNLAQYTFKVVRCEVKIPVRHKNL